MYVFRVEFKGNNEEHRGILKIKPFDNRRYLCCYSAAALLMFDGEKKNQPQVEANDCRIL